MMSFPQIISNMVMWWIGLEDLVKIPSVSQIYGVLLYTILTF